MAISGLIIKPKVFSVTTSLLLTKIKWNLGNEYLEFLTGVKYLSPLNLYLFLHGNFVTLPARVIFWHKIEKAFEIFPLPKVGLGAPPPGGLGPSGKLLAPDIPSPLRAIPIQSLPPSKFRHKFAPKNRSEQCVWVSNNTFLHRIFLKTHLIETFGAEFSFLENLLCASPWGPFLIGSIPQCSISYNLMDMR